MRKKRKKRKYEAGKCDSKQNQDRERKALSRVMKIFKKRTFKAKNTRMKFCSVPVTTSGLQRDYNVTAT